MAKNSKAAPKKKEKLMTQTELLSVHSGAAAAFQGLLISVGITLSEFSYIRDHFRSDFFGILLITEGTAEIKLNLQHYKLQKHDLMLVSPHALKQFVNSSNCQALGLSFTAHFLNQVGMPKNASELFSYFTSQYDPRWRLTDDDAAVFRKNTLDLFARCQQAESHPYGKEIVCHTFLTLMYDTAALSKKYTRITQIKLSRKEDLVMRFANMVNQRVKEQRSVQYYAGELHVTPKYLTETIKELSGKNAGEIIDEFAMLEAKVLLENPEISIAQVAEELHFSDASFFGKFFKRHSGMSPKAYRLASLT